MMKHSLRITAAAVSGLLLAGNAFAAGQNTGFYVQGDVGLANINIKESNFQVRNAVKDLKKSYKDSGFMPRVSVGYNFGNNVRAAVDYTHYKTLKGHADIKQQDGATTLTGRLNQKTKSGSLGVAVMYDFPVEALPKEVKPYVGARLGINTIKETVSGQLSETTTSGNSNSSQSASGNSSKSSVKTGLGAMAGIGYEISPNMTADAGYRYNRLGGKAKAHEVSVGIRYSF